MMHRNLLIAAAALTLAACSDTTDTDKDTGGGTQDGGATCGAGIYPCGPYGTTAGKVAPNREFQAFADPKNLCKAHKDKQLDISKLQAVSFKDWHLGDSAAGCDKYKRSLLWIMVGAGWCGPCKVEAQHAQAKYQKGEYDERLGLLNVIYETTTPNTPADEAFIKTWAEGFKLSFPVAMDPKFTMGAFFARDKAPFNLLVETKTMKVVYSQQGGKIDTIEGKIKTFLGN